MLCVVILVHARPSEQFEGKEGGYQSTNRKSKECVAPSKNDAELAE